MELRDELEQAINQDPIDITNEETRRHFEVTNDEQALWALRKLQSLNRRRSEVVSIHDTEQAKLATWMEGRLKPIDNDREFFSFLLTRYAVQCRSNEQDGRKSISLPAGTIKTHATRAKVVIEHDDDFISWAAANVAARDLLVQSVKVDKKRLNEQSTILDDGTVVIDGEVVPGLRAEPATISVTIDTEA